MKRGKERWHDLCERTVVCLICCALFTAISGRLALAGEVRSRADVRRALILVEKSNNHHERYRNLPPDQRQRIKKKLRQWQSLSPEEQRQMRRNMDQLNRMPPEGRRLYQKRFHQWQRLSPQEQERLRRQLRNWDQLSGEEKKAIRGKFK